MVLAPPVALFLGEKADEASLLEALTLSVELDERAAEALATLRAVLGPPTFVVASGGSWTDPATGEVQTWYLDHARRRFGASGWRVAQAAGRAVFDRRTVAYGSVANLERQGLVRRTIRPRRGNLLGVVAYHGVILERVRACGLNFLWTHDPLASASNRGLRACRARRLRGERAAVLAQLEAEERLHVLTELGRAALVAAEMSRGPRGADRQRAARHRLSPPRERAGRGVCGHTAGPGPDGTAHDRPALIGNARNTTIVLTAGRPRSSGCCPGMFANIRVRVWE